MTCTFCNENDYEFSCETCFIHICCICRSRCQKCMDTICPDCENEEGICNNCLEQDDDSDDYNKIETDIALKTQITRRK